MEAEILVRHTREDAADCIARLGESLDFPLTLDDSGQAVMEYGGDLPLLLQWTADGRLVFAASIFRGLMSLPGLAESVLTYSWLGIRISGGAFCYNRDSDDLILWKAYSRDELSTELVRAELEDFIGVALATRNDLREIVSSSEGSQGAPESEFKEPRNESCAFNPGSFA